MNKIKKWLYVINFSIMTIWITFFPDTNSLDEAIKKGGRTTIFNQFHPFHFFYCLIFFAITIIFLWDIFKNKDK